MNIHSHSSFHVLPAFLKLLVLKNVCTCNSDNAHNIDICPDEKIMTKSEPAKQAQTNISIVKALKTYLNDLKSYLTTYQGFKMSYNSPNPW